MVAATRQALVAGLSASLEQLAARLQRQGAAAAEIAVLAARAEQIAADARQLARGRPSPATVEHLGEQLDALARDVARLAERAGAEATLGREVAEALLAHAPSLAGLQEITELPELRRRLEPLAATIEAIPPALRGGGSALAAELSGLARRAGDLADEAHEAASDPALLRDAALRLGSGLRGFAEDVATVSTKLSEDADFAERAARALAAEARGGDARLGEVIASGRALVWPPLGAA
jgi:DNA repair exonuclease SbcCD ATPase subunit